MQTEITINWVGVSHLYATTACKKLIDSYPTITPTHGLPANYHFIKQPSVSGVGEESILPGLAYFFEQYPKDNTSAWVMSNFVIPAGKNKVDLDLVKKAINELTYFAVGDAKPSKVYLTKFDNPFVTVITQEGNILRQAGSAPRPASCVVINVDGTVTITGNTLIQSTELPHSEYTDHGTLNISKEHGMVYQGITHNDLLVSHGVVTVNGLCEITIPPCVGNLELTGCRIPTVSFGTGKYDQNNWRGYDGVTKEAGAIVIDHYGNIHQWLDGVLELVDFGNIEADWTAITDLVTTTLRGMDPSISLEIID